MTSLGDSGGRSESRLNLSHMYYSMDSYDLKHAIVVSRLGVLVFFLRTPRIGSRTPTVIKKSRLLKLNGKCYHQYWPQDVKYNDAFDRRQVNYFAVDFKSNLFLKVLPRLPGDHLSQTHLNIDSFIVKAAVESLRVLFSCIMKAEAEIGIDSKTKVVVHHVNGSIVFGCRASHGYSCRQEWWCHWRSHGSHGRRSCRCSRGHRRLILNWDILGRDLRSLIRVENNCPSIKSDFFSFDNISQEVERVFSSSITRTPSQDTSQVISSPERNYCTWRRWTLRVLTNIVKTLKDPTNCAIASTHEDLVVFDVTKYVESEKKTRIRTILFDIFDSKESIDQTEKTRRGQSSIEWTLLEKNLRKNVTKLTQEEDLHFPSHKLGMDLTAFGMKL